MLEGSSSEEALPAAIIFLVIMPPGIAIQLVMPTGQRSSKRQPLLLVSFAIWVIYSAAVLIEVWNIIRRMLGRDAYPLWSIDVNIALTMAYMYVGDCLMLWRLVPIILFLPYFAFGIIAVIDILTACNLPPIAGALCVAFSVMTNIVITSLSTYKVLIARREAIRSEVYDSVPSLYRDMIVILVESAAPLALAGMCAVAVSAARLSKGRHDESTPGLYLSVVAFNLLFLLFSALSPQMILFHTLACLPRGTAMLAAEGGYHRERCWGNIQHPVSTCCDHAKRSPLNHLYDCDDKRFAGKLSCCSQGATLASTYRSGNPKYIFL
ncbi:hypothetical protein BKA70DRAFT_1225444 [Coprinopsis sp. MPI-PUGE-AT-0042]|nr:hypothetical protein BKA70DRAFT_1225444 [Coprinopsis sp. MPI-PUGE-AT-0042]